MTDFYKNKTVAVAGGTGFIGTHYILKLLEYGAKVVTHTHVRPLQIESTKIDVLQNWALTIPIFSLHNLVQYIYFKCWRPDF